MVGGLRVTQAWVFKASRTDEHMHQGVLCVVKTADSMVRDWWEAPQMRALVQQIGMI